MYFSHYFAIVIDSLPLEKILTLHNAIILINIVLNKDKNHYYYKIFLGKCLYQLAKKQSQKSFLQYSNSEIYNEQSNKRKVLCWQKPIKIWDVKVDNIVISKLIEIKVNSKYLIGYLDKAIRPLVSIMPQIREYVKTFKVKDEDKDKKNKLMFFRIDDEKLLQKYKAISTKIEDLKNIKLNSIPVYDNGYIKTKVKTYGDKFCTNFRGLNVADDYIECEFFTVIFIDSLHVDENKNYVQVYLDNCAYSTILA